MFSPSGIPELFKNLQACVSLIPAAVAGFDAGFGFLPVSSALKPWIYVLLFVFIAYALLAETSRYVSIKSDSAALARRRRAARWIIVAGLFLAALYFVGTKSENAWRPDRPGLLELSLFLLSVCFAFAFERFTRALLILGLYRPRQNPSDPQEEPGGM